MKKVFLEDLIRYESGIDKGKINWGACIGHKIKFTYKDIENSIDIIGYNKQKKRLTVTYDNKEFEISTGNLQKCKLGRIIGKVSSNFKIEVGARFKDEKKDITIVHREIREKNTKKQGEKVIYNDKWYKYHCNKCGYDKGEIVESNLLTLGNGCPCCSNPPRIVVEGINDIPTKSPWMIPYFQGGIEEARLYTPKSNQKINPICPDCGKVKLKKMPISVINQLHSVGCTCGDDVPYPEKLMFNVLEQLGVDFQTQLSKVTFNWCKNYKYDFYFKFNKEEYIIETHGEQHYKESFQRINSIKKVKTLLKEQENDECKKQLALNNRIKEQNYIIIDCRKSKLEWIKESILNSNLKSVFDLSKINWLEVNELACSSLVKKACEFKKNNPNMTSTEIAKIMKYDRHTISRWLKRGNGIWCYYNAEEESQKNIKNNLIKMKKK